VTALLPSDVGARLQATLNLAARARETPLTPSEHEEAARIVIYLLSLRDQRNTFSEVELAAWLAPLLCRDQESTRRFHDLCARARNGRVAGSAHREANAGQERRGGSSRIALLGVAVAVLAAAVATISVGLYLGIISLKLISPNLRELSGEEQLFIISLPGFLMLGAAFLVFSFFARTRRALARSAARQIKGDAAELALARTAKPMPSWPGAFALAQAIRPSDSALRLSPERTAVAFAETGGRFRPIWAKPRRQKTIAIVERSGPYDHQARRFENLLATLANAGVALERWFLDRSGLRLARGHDNVRVEDLTNDAQDAALIYLGNGDTLTDMNGEVRKWSAPLLASDKIAIITPQARARWGETERVLSDLTGGRIFTSTWPHASADAQRSERWLWENSPGRWVHEGRPDRQLRSQLLKELRRYFAESNSEKPNARSISGGFAWLCACAIFPAIRPEITDFLGERVGDENNLPLRTERRAALLAVLPWMREGRMPDWLRRELVRSLPSKIAQRVRRQLREALVVDPLAQDRGLRVIVAGLGGQTVARDSIVIEFASSNDPLTLRLENAVARALQAGRALPAARGATERSEEKRASLSLGEPRFSWSGLPASPVGGAAKRAFDIVIAFSALVVLAPLLVVTAIAVRLESPGNVIFKQDRVGLGGRHFRIWKFRTMSIAADRGIVQTRQSDARVTRLGRFLRRSSWDELPQLVNVLIGDMSIVGPRPHAVEHDRQFTTMASQYGVRHLARPGITGLAQVNGARGPTETEDKVRARTRFDVEYVRRWSFLNDIRILVATVRVLFFANSDS